MLFIKEEGINKMRSRSISLIVLAAIYSVCWACHNRTSASPAAEVAEPGTLKIIVYHEEPGVSYKDRVGTIRNIARNLGLPVLTGGYRGLHVRIWVRDSTKMNWVIDLRKSPRGGSGCTILSYTSRRKDTIQYVYLHEQRDVKPRSGWVNFFDGLQKYHISEMDKGALPNDRESSFTSMDYAVFEIDEPNEYRFVEYPDPLFFRNENKTSKMIDDFFRYFNSEMGTTIYDSGKYAND